MIPDEAVEAAAKTMASQTDEPPYGVSPELDAAYRRYARVMLKAAAPYMLARAWEEGYRWGYSDSAWSKGNEPDKPRKSPHDLLKLSHDSPGTSEF